MCPFAREKTVDISTSGLRREATRPLPAGVGARLVLGLRMKAKHASTGGEMLAPAEAKTQRGPKR